METVKYIVAGVIAGLVAAFVASRVEVSPLIIASAASGVAAFIAGVLPNEAKVEID